jgi:hypothetical protein
VPERLLSATRGGLELWLDATKWWTGAVADSAGAVVGGAGAWREDNEWLLREAVGRLARAFEERQIEVELGGSPVRATLESIQLYRGGRDGALLTFRDVNWNGVLIDRLKVIAEQTAISSPPTMMLTLSGVKLEGRVAFSELVAWLDRGVARWELRATEEGLIEAVSHNRGWRLTFEPALLGGELQVELRELRWRSVRIPGPRLFRVLRRLQLPSLPAGISVSEARRAANDVEFVLDVPPISRRLDVRGPLARVLP